MLNSVFGSVVSAIAYLFKIVSNFTDYFKTKREVDSGKILQQAENIINNEKIQEEQTKILVQDRPKSEVLEKLEKGTF
jgi:hypothetical protein